MENIQENNDRIVKTTPLTIFTNNFLVTTVTLIPYFGWGYILFVMWNTGLVVASYNNALLLVLINPFAWIELSVNAVAILLSYKLLRLALNKAQPNRLRLIGTYLLKGIGLIAAILAISAVLEYIFVMWG